MKHECDNRTLRINGYYGGEVIAKSEESGKSQERAQIYG